MKRWMVLWAACLAVSRVLAGWEMLTSTRLDPSRMTESYTTDAVKMAYPVTVFLPECTSYTISYMMQLRSPAAFQEWLDGIHNSNWMTWTMYDTTVAAARATAEGGPALEEEQPWDYDTPLTLNASGQFSYANALPANIKWDRWGGFPDDAQTILAVNVETDSDLTLMIGAEEFEIEAASGRQRINAGLTTGSRSVSVAAADPDATVKLGWATLDWIEFFEGGTVPVAESGEIQGWEYDLSRPNAPWYMVVGRSKIENGTLTCQLGICTVTNDHWRTAKTYSVDTDRFAKNARARMCIALPGGTAYYDADKGGRVFQGVATWGLKVQTGWLTDAQIRRVADLDFKELHRRGATFPGVSNDYWEQIQ